MNNIISAFEALDAFRGEDLKDRVAELETRISNSGVEDVARHLAETGVTKRLLGSSLLVKRASAQIDTVIHAVGILLSLPHILTKGERVESTSLGAGNTGRAHDLVTDRRIAEFKFIHWKGGSESVRQNGLFIDLFKLAIADTDKNRQLFLLGTKHALRCLRGRRQIESVLSKNKKIREAFRDAHGDHFQIVNEYYEAVSDRVEIVDLEEAVPKVWAAG